MLLLLLLNMNSQQLSAVSTFSTNENKALLWSVLQGGGKFVGIPESLRHNIQEMFESTIREISEHYRRLNQPVNLNAVNKEAVVIICKKIDAVKEQRQPPQQPQQQIYQKKQQQVPQLETVYTAQELQKERQNAFQNEFKKKEEEMSSILRLKKPEEINFTDDVYDKPIGNDMERLLAEALASREKELEQIKNVAFPPPSSSSSLSDSYKPSTSTTTATATATSTVKGGENVGIEKRVSFGREHVIENRQQYEDENEHNNGTNDDGDISFIFNKLKKIKTHKNEQHENEQRQNEHDKGNYVNENNINSHDATIIKMSQDIEYIKTALAELLEKVNK